MPGSKAQKILRRTLSGGALLATVALLLWWNASDASGLPLYWCTSAILFAAIVETSRMGSLALHSLRPALLTGALAAVLLTNAAIDGAWLRAGAVELPDVLSLKGSPSYVAGLAIVACAALAVHGLTRAFVRAFRRVEGARLLALGVVVAVLAWGLGGIGGSGANTGAALLLLVLLAAVSAPLAAMEPGGGRRLLVVGGLAVWLIPPLPALWGVWHAWGTGGLVALLLLSKIGDTAGYYVGGAIGRTHPFPRISPGKTTAGCVASLAAATAVAAVLHVAGVLPAGSLGIAGALLAGASINVAAQAGDLLESWVKRRVGVKDSSEWFGPSGGLLDQLDSLLLSIPVALATWPWLLGR